ncbi:MAG: DUF1080 domain-containing protein [Prolixibacteraceae bacterium]|nr:DUF1080 domain-containing protein [Prolixibacteraceae bacterium]
MKHTRFFSMFSSKFYYLLIALTLFVSISFTSQSSNTTAGDQPIIGRWDITVQMGDQSVPSWLEVKLSGLTTLVGYFVAESGSARPISKVNVSDGKITFSIPPQWDNADKDMVFEGTIENDKLKGVITSSSGNKHSFVGERAPLLKRNTTPEWGTPIALFDGRNLDAWHPQKSNNQWVVENGILRSPKPGTNLITNQKFDDFKLHIEFRYPEEGNTGIYLRGRYEVQIEDSKGKEPSSVYLGGVYGFLTPNENVAKSPGEWQTYDITLIGRRVTIEANGKIVICDQIIPGITGGAIDSKEGEPGPIMLQGDHQPADYRNIIITPAK